MKKTQIAVVIILTLTLGLAWRFNTAAVVDHGLVLYGNVDIRQVSLAFDGTGRITKLNVQEGDHVQIGEVIGELDTRTLALELAQAEAQMAVKGQALQRLRNGTRPEEIAQARANLSAAQAEAGNATRQLSRLNAVNSSTQGKTVSQLDIGNAETLQRMAQAKLENIRKALDLALAGPRREEIGEAQAHLDAARAQVDLFKHRIDEAKLRSPINAVVRSRLLEPGDMASPRTPVFTLAITDPKWVRAYVPEVELGTIKPGMAAQVSTDSRPAEAIPGRVGYISSVAEFTPKTVQTEEIRTSLVYEVRIFVDDPADRLRLGMPATVRFAADTSEHKD